MPTAYYVPIEPLTERYTESWYRNFPRSLRVMARPNTKVVTIDGEPLIADEVKVGTFLDINSTVHYKCTQLAAIASLFQEGKVQSGDCFFFGDVEFWGIESVRLMAQMNNVSVRLTGFLHAASYTIEDAFAVAEPYQKYTEVGWLAALDEVFVGSQYHKNAVVERRLKPLGREDLANRICVTGNPFFSEDYALKSPVSKQKKLILPNRFDWEKRPNLSLQLAYLAKKEIPDLEVVVTTSRKTFRSNRQWLTDLARGMEKDGIITIKEGLSKAEYHEELASSKVMLSTSIEENFGYCIAEALWYNTYPLLPRSVGSHSEMVKEDSSFLYDSEDEVVNKIKHLLSRDDSVNHTTDRWVDAADTIAAKVHGQ